MNDAPSALEDEAQSFIVRVWLEEPASAAYGAVWRGAVTHVPSGTRLYVKELEEITAFIAGYLAEMGVRMRVAGGPVRWLARRVRSLPVLGAPRARRD